VHIEGNITTVRNTTASGRGMLSFAGTANWVSSNGSFVDGYVRSHKTGAFVFPVGQGVYRPAAISGAAETAPTDAAYYNTAQFAPTALSDELSAITNESWVIQGTTAATITLSWSSNLSAFADLLDDLCVAGWDPSLNKWVEVPSETDAISTIFGVASQLNTRGSVSTTSAVVPNSYAAYTIGVKTIIVPIDAETPTIITHPADVTVIVGVEGATTTLSVVAVVDDGGTLTYQWYSNTTPSNTGGTEISGATGATFKAPMDVEGTFYYYVVVTNTSPDNDDVGNKTATATGNVATIKVNENPSLICPTQVHDKKNNIYYNVVEIAGLCWTKNNLYSTLYQDGTAIPFAKPYIHPKITVDEEVFGLLYTWESAMSIQSICPIGWHIPSESEWMLLDVAASIPNELMSTAYWINLGPGTDNFGFTAYPAGWYHATANKYKDLYSFAGWWSSKSSATTATIYTISYYCNNSQFVEKNKNDGLSVRCVMD
jgi:uncharacterized protein (TIGR02145 family)